MNKKLITLAVAAAMAAPAIASAEAILYGKLNVSIDYADVENSIRPVFNNYADDDIFVRADGSIATTTIAGRLVPVLVPTGQPLTQAQADALIGTQRVAPNQQSVGQNFKGWGLAKGNGYIPGEGRASRIGVKGSEDLGNGLKAIYQVELGINLSDTNNNLTSGSDTISYRNTFAGLAGDWGTVLAGRHDTPMKISTGKLDLFADTMADYNGTVGFLDLRADNAVAYISPNWSGFQLALATVASGGATALGTTNINSDQINGAYSLAAIYSNGPFYGSAAYEALSNEMFMSTATSLNSEFGCIAPSQPSTSNIVCNYVEDDTTQWRLGLGLLDWNGFSLTGVYAEIDNLAAGQTYALSGAAVPADQAFLLPGGSDKVKQWQIQAGYKFGSSMIKAMYGQASYEAEYSYGGERPLYATSFVNDIYDGDRETWAIGYDYSFSKRTIAYALYTQVTDDMSDLPVLASPLSGVPTATSNAFPVGPRNNWDGFSIGLMHSF